MNISLVIAWSITAVALGVTMTTIYLQPQSRDCPWIHYPILEN